MFALSEAKNAGHLFFLFLNLFFLLIAKDSFGFEEKIIAIINEDIITGGELNNSSSSSSFGVFTEKSISFLVEKKLQMQIAKKRGISVQDEDISAAIDDIKRANSYISDKDFEDSLLKEGTSIEEYKRDLKDQLTILKLINKEIHSKITVNDKDIEDYYSSNKNLFQSEEIRIGYIFIPIKASESLDSIRNAQNRIKDILSDLKNNMTLNEIKKRYTEYPTEYPEVYVIEDLGYVKRGELLKELDMIAFNLGVGKISDVIYTPAGFYILKVLENKKTEYKPLKDVKEQIIDLFLKDKSESLYKDWLYEIKSSSYIELKI